MALEEQSLAQSDSLQRTYKRVLEQQMESKSTPKPPLRLRGIMIKTKLVSLIFIKTI